MGDEKGGFDDESETDSFNSQDDQAKAFLKVIIISQTNPMY